MAEQARGPGATAIATGGVDATDVVTPPVVRFRTLLALYLIVPASLVFVGFDRWLNDEGLRALLPKHPEGLVLYSVVFNLPHIVSGHLLFIDHEYARRYGKQLVGGGLAFLALMVFGSPRLIAVVGLVLLTCHVLGQQMGLTAPQIRARGLRFSAWKWLCILIGGLGYYGSAAAPVDGTQPAWAAQFEILSLVLMPGALVLAVLLGRRAPTVGGRLYLWANTVMVIGMHLLGALGYPMLSVLMPRFVHDFTAFYVYGVHDDSRNAGVARNPVYRALAFTGISPRYWSPVLGIGIALAIKTLPHDLRLPVVAWLSGMHYYLESFIWRSGSLHRQSVRFV